MTKVSATRQKETRIKNFLENYETKFDMEDAEIDLRTMSENYEHGVIPSVDVSKAINAVLGDPFTPTDSIDPREDKTLPKFAWVPNTLTAIQPKFQRDVSPNHTYKIEMNFDGRKIIVPCAVKDPRTGLYLLWDGNHTSQTCIRQGWSHVPVWYIEIEPIEDESEEDMIKRMIQLAGEAFLSVNKLNKRAVKRYDEHMIRVETYEPTALQIQSIVNTAGCVIKRAPEGAGAISHIEHCYGAYELTQASTGVKGMYLARALRFYRNIWPKENIDGLLSLCLARLFQQTELATGVLLPPEFDDEFGAILKDLYGPGSIVQHELKEQYEEHFGGLAGHPLVVTSGLLCTYAKHGKQFRTAQPETVFPVR